MTRLNSDMTDQTDEGVVVALKEQIGTIRGAASDENQSDDEGYDG